MRAGEAKLWDYLRRGMGHSWDVQRHEDRYSPDIPDLSFSLGGMNGWMELKHTPTWPKRISSPVRLSHFTAGQKNWLHRRKQTGCGSIWLLWQIDKHYFLISPEYFGDVGTMNMETLMKISRYQWRDRINFTELIFALEKGYG